MKYTCKHRLGWYFMVGLGVYFYLTMLCLLALHKTLISNFARCNYFFYVSLPYVGKQDASQ